MADNNREHYHNKGQEDAAAGRPYDAPHDTIIDTLSKYDEKDTDEKEHYDAGWRHAKSQKK